MGAILGQYGGCQLRVKTSPCPSVSVVPEVLPLWEMGSSFYLTAIDIDKKKTDNLTNKLKETD